MSKQKKKTNWGQYILLISYVLIGGVCGFSMGPLYDRTMPEDASIWLIMAFYALFLVLMFGALFLQLLLHEAGHLVFGLASGYKFSSFRIMSFMFYSDNGKIKCKRLAIAGTGGQCLMDPPEMQNGKFPVVLFNLGGALMNIIVSGIAAVLYFIFSESLYISTFLFMVVLIGIVFALTNGIPMRLGTIDNDGYNAYALTRNDEALHSFWIQLRISDAQLTKGTRIKDMPEEWFGVPSDESMKNSMTAVKGVFTCNRYMDEHRFDEADEHMAHLLAIESGIAGLHRFLLICDRMYCEMIRENRMAILLEMRTEEQLKMMKAMKDFPTVLRTEYVYNLLALKDTEEAEKIKTHFEKIAKRYPYPGDIESERELMQIAESIANVADTSI